MKQLKFLREQGLIQNEQDVKGGAGADAVSVTSSNMSATPKSPKSAHDRRPRLSLT